MMNINRLTNLQATLINFQPVRWRTKPRWIPTAKTKIFRVSKRPIRPEADAIENQKLVNIYSTHMKSINAFLRQRYRETQTADEVFQKLEEEEEMEWQEALKINDEWNVKQKVERERLDAERVELMKEEALLKVMDYEQRQQDQIKIIDELIRAEKEKSKFYITRDNIDEAIEKALETYTDFNFAIDLKNNIYYGTRGSVASQHDPRISGNTERIETSNST